MHAPREKRSKLDSKLEKYIVIEYKDGVKGYKLWNPVTRKVFYNRDVIFRELIGTSKDEEDKRENEPENKEFEINNESLVLGESIESGEQEEQQTPVFMRFGRSSKKKMYTPPNFFSAFVLATIEDDMRSIKEVIDSI